ncbi:glycosyltransferase family 2 protein [Synechococcus sp. CS-1332]|uniref:glycosyltransferase family 2 protein n=1 Tax=Synechococcus sp. CS-1332 TaxID=2847972 RepID=UPI00223A7AC8|nr:glycosyltransferase family 2 protein [Synechococcus sp. CS-1332]MCT0206231.1 glycosyltransferase family 2 protein [Synechococcus sp. CS-1332]
MRTIPEAGKLLLSVIIPCFNEEKSLPVLIDRLEPLLCSAFGSDRWEIILVNDGSHDMTESCIENINQVFPNVWGISLTRNFGHQPALYTGLQNSGGEICALMDADMQDPPEILLDLIRIVHSGEQDVAYGVRANREAGPLIKACYKGFYRLMGSISEHPWQVDAGDFCAMNRRAVNMILSFPERDKFLRGLRSWVGLRQLGVSYSRPKRLLGKSRYNYSRLYLLAMKGVVGFSTIPLRIASFLSLGSGLFCALVAGLLMINRIFPAFTLFGYNIGANQGIATLAVMLLLVSSAILAALGIIGEYLAVVLVEVKQRPVSFISRIIKA